MRVWISHILVGHRMTRLVEFILRHSIGLLFPEPRLQLILMSHLCFSVVRDWFLTLHGEPIVSAPERVTNHLVVSNRLEYLLIEGVEVL